MSSLAQAEAGLIGIAILAVIGLVLYESWEHKDLIEAVATTVSAVEDVAGIVTTKVVEGIEIDAVAIDDLVKGDSTEAKKDYLEFESGGKATGQWLDLFGSDKYNDGFGSFHFRMISENCEALAKRYGDATVYLSTLSAGELEKYQAMSIAGVKRFSPFWIRQNIPSLSVAERLHGWVGTSARSFQESIWTDWDRFRDWIINYDRLSSAMKDRMRKMVESDVDLLREMDENNVADAWIIRDRVMIVGELFARKGAQF